VTDVETPRGLARFDLVRPIGTARSLLIIGHGAGGGVEAPDIVAVRDAVLPRGVVVARVTQPYRVLGKGVPPKPEVLDEAWITVVRAIHKGVRKRLPLIVGGRSSGARVACRTAAELGAAAVLALAFPLHPPGHPEKSRAGEIDPSVPTLIVNGSADPFGVPDPADGVDVLVRPGARHDLRKGLAETSALVGEWLCRMGLAA
jgi:predicted alpha/beta-hydrolase family hydrolase